ncbi:hypothetical protein MNBD_GAMMA01-715, partial [hydrothermal vent metagenome]
MLKFRFNPKYWNKSVDISHLRQEYCKTGLSRGSLDDSPFVQFGNWFEQAQNAKLNEPNAMSIATVSASGVPS